MGSSFNKHAKMRRNVTSCVLFRIFIVLAFGSVIEAQGATQSPYQECVTICTQRHKNVNDNENCLDDCKGFLPTTEPATTQSSTTQPPMTKSNDGYLKNLILAFGLLFFVHEVTENSEGSSSSSSMSLGPNIFILISLIFIIKKI